MAKAEGLPPTASVASVGPGINYAGNWVYAYSQSLSFDNSPEVTLLEFNSGEGTIRAQIICMRSDTDSLNSFHKVYLNDELVMLVPLGAGDTHSGAAQSPYHLILPPMTNFKITIVNISNTSSGTGLVTLTGRVYDV